MIKHHLREFGELSRYTVTAAGARLGSLTGLVFDCRSWRVRQFVVAAARGPLFIPIERFVALDDAARELSVDSPHDMPAASRRTSRDDTHRVDAAALVARPVEGRDGPAGRIVDLLVNVNVWEMRYLVIATPAGRVLTDIEWASDLDDCPARPALDLPAVAIRSAPLYSGLDGLCSGDEEALYRHYTSRDYLRGDNAG